MKMLVVILFPIKDEPGKFFTFWQRWNWAILPKGTLFKTMTKSNYKGIVERYEYCEERREFKIFVASDSLISRKQYDELRAEMLADYWL